MEFLTMVDIFFNISPWTGNLLSRLMSKTKSTSQLDFFANRVIYFWNKLSNQIKNSNSIENFKIKLYHFRKNCKKKNLRGYSSNYLTEFDLYIDIV